MTEPFDEYGDQLRRVLHAKADAVVPSAEGLEKIRATIEQRRERRLWYLRPWLRPLAALSAAVAISVIAVPATAAFRNFVQTGHFNPQTSHDDGSHTVDGKHTYNNRPPGPPPSDTRLSPRPSTDLSTSPGTHIVSGSCPPGEGEVTPSPAPSEAADSASPAPSGPKPRITCQPDTSPSSPSPHDPSGSTHPGPTQPPGSEPPTALPSPQLSP